MFKINSRLMLLLSLAPFGAANSQTTDMTKTAPIVCGTTAVEAAPKFCANFLKPAQRHMSPVGLPCMTVNAYSRPQTINPGTFDNVMILKNSCSNSIELTICYFGTQHCISPTLPGYTRREAVLGSQASTKDFRF